MDSAEVLDGLTKVQIETLVTDFLRNLDSVKSQWDRNGIEAKKQALRQRDGLQSHFEQMDHLTDQRKGRSAPPLTKQPPVNAE